MPVLWRFRCYLSENGHDVVREWHDRQSTQVKARFLSRLRILSNLPLEEWNDNLYKNLKGDCDGLSEIRFKAGRVQRRPLGFHSGKHEFTILFCATEKGGRFVPKSACQTALGRKAEVLESRSRTNALWLALE